jgi:hypothetical protein
MDRSTVIALPIAAALVAVLVIAFSFFAPRPPKR